LELLPEVSAVVALINMDPMVPTPTTIITTPGDTLTTITTTPVATQTTIITTQTTIITTPEDTLTTTITVKVLPASIGAGHLVTRLTAAKVKINKMVVVM